MRSSSCSPMPVIDSSVSDSPSVSSDFGLLVVVGLDLASRTFPLWACTHIYHAS